MHCIAVHLLLHYTFAISWGLHLVPSVFLYLVFFSFFSSPPDFLFSEGGYIECYFQIDLVPDKKLKVEIFDSKYSELRCAFVGNLSLSPSVPGTPMLITTPFARMWDTTSKNLLWRHTSHPNSARKSTCSSADTEKSI